ncbi:hypothetical protein AWC17_03235 [Mycobacterium nebraskense]|uniref:Uncharacterized protein n=1 Tax=Mycobacterium nebraskense TaxID=244292 RepID=A0A1X1ZMF2_9MYCO|nr:hypothetical protein [Mycobacterium nebraskense]ORW24569.1 hypothetical protein AWC17_03235 [Mycobacterium nebraskense]
MNLGATSARRRHAARKNLIGPSNPRTGGTYIAMRIAPIAPRLATEVLIPRICDIDQRPKHPVDTVAPRLHRAGAQQHVDDRYDLGNLCVN